MIERLLRAGAAVIAGLQAAVDHLREPPEAVVVEFEGTLCPECGRHLEEGPHFHEERGYWPMSMDGAVLVTDARGAALR